MEIENMLAEVYTAGDELKKNIECIKASQLYCAKAEVYIRWIKNNREMAEKILINFHEYRDTIFEQSLEILDIAIENENPGLAQAAMNQIKEIKKLYPEIYKSYFNRMFGNRK